MALAYEELTGQIIGAAMEVHRMLGCGFLEAVYEEALAIELQTRGVLFIAQQELNINYKGRILKQKYRPDMIVEGKVIVEIKALARLTSIEEAQVITYLKATGCTVALLINFGARSLEWKRLVLNVEQSAEA
jgi:GxxExxY protein